MSGGSRLLQVQWRRVWYLPRAVGVCAAARSERVSTVRGYSCVVAAAIRASRAKARRRLAASIDSPATAALRFLYTNHFEPMLLFMTYFSWHRNYCEVPTIHIAWTLMLQGTIVIHFVRSIVETQAASTRPMSQVPHLSLGHFGSAITRARAAGRALTRLFTCVLKDTLG